MNLPGDGKTFVSPLSWRYASEAMQGLWGERARRQLWRRVWVAMAEAQHELGLVSAQQVRELQEHERSIDLPRALELEADLRHDLMAELRTFADQCPTAGGILHLGATSLDVEDNADCIRIRDGLELVITRLEHVCRLLCDRVERWADTSQMGFSHLQAAGPTTVGHRLAVYAGDLDADRRALSQIREELVAKGLRGPVGTSAAVVQLMRGTGRSEAQARQAAEDLEQAFVARLGLRVATVATQTYPRRQDFVVVAALASLAASLHRAAMDFRVLQSTPWSEVFEGRANAQVSSSAMPFKRNPTDAETICGLARIVGGLPGLMWETAALAILERTLDGAPPRAHALPTAFLAIDAMLVRMARVLDSLAIDTQRIDDNMRRFGAGAGVERLLMAACQAGADRQRMHGVLAEHCLADTPGALVDRLAADGRITGFLDPDAIRAIVAAHDDPGLAPVRARRLAAEIRAQLDKETVR